MNNARTERLARTSTPHLDALTPARRKELIAQGVDFLKHRGVEGMVSEPITIEKPTRAQLRQVARATGWRGSKTTRHNIAKRVPEIQRALLVDDTLSAAQARMELSTADKIRLRLKERAAS